MKRYLCNLILLSLVTIILLLNIYGCIGKINKHKNFVNMIMQYYPEYNIEIIKSDPNALVVHISK